jgi:hypothetical protein
MVTSGGWWESTFGDLSAANIKLSHAWTLRRMTEWVEIVKLPPEQQGPRIQAIKNALPQRDQVPLLAGVLFPEFTRVSESNVLLHAQTRCTIVALAVERFRLKQQRWPKSLDELDRELLAKVPIDPYDGKPLRYRLLDDGAVVYSVGPDLVDNGGNLVRKYPAIPGTDVGFRLWNLDRRRQPPVNLEMDPPMPTPR